MHPTRWKWPRSGRRIPARGYARLSKSVNQASPGARIGPVSPRMLSSRPRNDTGGGSHRADSQREIANRLAAYEPGRFSTRSSLAASPARMRFVAATSSASDVVGFWTMLTL